VLKKLGIEWNRTADSRKVLTERRDITTEDVVQNIAQTCTVGSWVLSQGAAECLCVLIVKSSLQSGLLVRQLTLISVTSNSCTIT
jgi:hypothetical protein